MSIVSPVTVIAEVGVNHDGSVDRARHLIDAATDAGADVVKFQTFSSDELSVPEAPLANYQSKQGGTYSNQAEMLRSLSLSTNDWETLAEHCLANGVEFLSTGFDEDSIDMLVKLGMSRIKIASGDVTNVPLLRHVSTLNLPVILSTGMCTLEEVRDALQLLTTEKVERQGVCVLHCTSLYPTPPHAVNLLAMQTVRREFSVSVGYSDHTLGWEVPVAAVALGATVIEKHLTHDVGAPGPDHAASLEAQQFSEMVRAIRLVEVALGSGDKSPQPGEEEMRLVARRSIVARRQIVQGRVITSEDVTVKRPGLGISPMHWDSIVGLRANRNYEPDEMIEW